MSKKKPPRKKPWRGYAIALAFPILAGSAFAQEPPSSPAPEAKEEEDVRAGRPDHDVFGIEVHPFAAFEFQRLAEVAEWSPALTSGVEIDWDPIWFGASYSFHDVLSDREAVPWDGTLILRLGLYQGGLGTLGSVPTYVHAAVAVARPSGPDRWSPGFEGGLELDMEPIYIGFAYMVHDVGMDDDVYSWDATTAISLGCYW